MKRNALIIFAILLSASTMFAQISERENESITVKLGARPAAGDMALTFGIAAPGILTGGGAPVTANFQFGNLMQSGALITGKYYLADDMVIRAGLRLVSGSTTFTGELADTAGFLESNIVGWANPDTVSTVSQRGSAREYIIVPGIEKHFSKSNIFDVYAGGDLYLGLAKGVETVETDWLDGDYNHTTVTTSASVVGLGGVVGFNVFIAHLPISVGLEYGWNARWRLGGKTKVVEDISLDDASEKLEYELNAVDAFGNPVDAFGNPDNNVYSSLKRRDFNMDTNQNVRLVLNIYFGQ